MAEYVPACLADSHLTAATSGPHRCSHCMALQLVEGDGSQLRVAIERYFSAGQQPGAVVAEAPVARLVSTPASAIIPRPLHHDPYADTVRRPAFRGGIGRCPGSEALWVQGRQPGQRRRKRLGKAKVKQAHPVIVQHDIAGLHIAVQHTLSMDVTQRVQQPRCNTPQFLPRHPARAVEQQLVQGRALITSGEERHFARRIPINENKLPARVPQAAGRKILVEPQVLIL